MNTSFRALKLAATLAVDKKSARDELLLKMYDQLFNDINRHILVVWQCIGVVIGAFAVFALAEREKAIIPIDVAVALEVILVMWLLGHLLDASNWYNRNLVIIANIEKQFLTDTDQRDIQYYFVHHRPHKMITHLRLQAVLGFAVGGVVLWFHFLERVWPGINSPWSNFSSYRALPYVVLVCGAIVVVDLWLRNYYGFTEFKQKSPGVTVADLYPDVEAFGHGRMKGPLAGIRQWLATSQKDEQREPLNRD